jgi:hypothetical protein
MAKEKIIKVTKKNVKKGKKTRKKAKPGDKRICNDWWKRRKTHGRKKVFKDPDTLWKFACKYFKHVQENPLVEEKIFASKGDLIRGDVSKMQAMTLRGLYVFLNIHHSTWQEYRELKDYTAVIEDIENVIYTQKLTGSAAGLLNANIIARELGLADKKEVSGSLDLNTLTDDQLDNQITDAEEKLNGGD